MSHPFDSISSTPLQTEPTPTSNDRIRIPHALLFYFIFLLVALIWSFTQNGPVLFFRYFTWKGLIPSIAGGIMGALVIIALSEFCSRCFLWAQQLEQQFARHLTPLNISEIITLALVSGFCEEVFFRGTMQPSWGLAATTTVFAGAHFIPSRKWIAWFFLTLPVGCFLGILFAKTQNLWGCCIAHILINGVNLSLLNMKFQGKRSLIWNA